MTKEPEAGNKKIKEMMKNAFVLLLIFSNSLYAQKNILQPEEMLQPAVLSISLVMMHDVVSPPVAARYYAYSVIGAYDIMAAKENDLVPLSSVINGYTCCKFDKTKQFDYGIAATYCIYETGRLMLPSGFMLEEKQKKFLADLKKKYSKKIIDASVAVADTVAAQVVAWSKTDNYNKLSAKLRYTPLKGDGYWYPTPPSYMEAVEPNWRTIRPMLLDSGSEFKPILPTTFSKDSGSAFYALAKEVYDVSKNLSPEQLDIASFWDCNPFVVATSGHMMLGFKKITPGGHWMNITCIAAKNAHLNMSQAVELQTLVAITLMDGFISSWDEKYRSNRIRPETYINRYIDVKWQPLLQTPPFPEYTSAHSVISTAAATVLGYMLGENFSFTDNSEQMFDLQPRNFTSFMQAANEAAISRLYGGIHFRDAIENGQAEGKNIGAFIVSKLKDAGVKPLM